MKMNYNELVVALSLINVSKGDKPILSTGAVWVVLAKTFKIEFFDASKLMLDLISDYRLLDSTVFHKEGDKITMISPDREDVLTGAFLETCSLEKRMFIQEVVNSFNKKQNFS